VPIKQKHFADSKRIHWLNKACPFLERNTPDFATRMKKAMSQGKNGCGLTRMFKDGGDLNRMLTEQKARLYIIRRCVAMLLCHRESTND
jgi:hypothetical protein